MNIAETLSAQAVATPDVPAILDYPGGRRRSLTFAGLELASARAAALLRQAGLNPGDVVLVFQPMSAELYVALAAIFRLGLVAMFLDPVQGRGHIEQCCALCKPRALIASDKAHLLQLVSPALRRIPLKFVIGFPVPGAIPWKDAVALPPLADIHAASPDSPALLTFTSGSTGQPKAAGRTHAFLLAQHRVLAGNLGLTPGEVNLSSMPIVVLSNLASGVTSLIPPGDLRRPGRVEPAPVAAAILSEDASSAVASPALWERLARHCLTQSIRLDCLKKIFTGGAPVFPPLLEKLQYIAPLAQITAVYGSTEAEPMAEISYATIRPEDLHAMRNGKGLLAGRPVEEIELRIIPDQWGTPLRAFDKNGFEAQCCPAGETGEIVVSGAHVLAGYLHGHGNLETKFSVEGVTWHRTGDAGYLDPQGRLWLLGRCAARIDDQRGRLYPFAVECAVSFWPGLRRTAVVAHKGRRVLVAEQSDRDLSISPLKDALAWAHIDDLRVIKRVPVDKRHNAKIDYPALRRLLDK